MFKRSSIFNEINNWAFYLIDGIFYQSGRVALVMQVCIERKKMCKRNYWLKISKVKMKVVPQHKRKSYGKSFFEILSGSKVREQNPRFQYMIYEHKIVISNWTNNSVCSAVFPFPAVWSTNMKIFLAISFLMTISLYFYYCFKNAFLTK